MAVNQEKFYPGGLIGGFPPPMPTEVAAPAIAVAIKRTDQIAGELEHVFSRIAQMKNRTLGARPEGVGDQSKAPTPSGYVGQFEMSLNRLQHITQMLGEYVSELESAL